MRRELDPVNNRFDRGYEMWKEHNKFMRLGYDGHNRRSGGVTSGTLRKRRNRRNMKRFMARSTQTANGEVVRHVFEPGFDLKKPRVIEPYILTPGLVCDFQARGKTLPLLPILHPKAS